MSEFGPEDERLEAIYDRLEELDPNTFESRAAELLHGLGFSRIMMARKTKDMSGECCREGTTCMPAGACMRACACGRGGVCTQGRLPAQAGKQG